jgi:molybdopterin-binding protein
MAWCEEHAEELARYAEKTLDGLKARIASIPESERPRVYYGRAPTGSRPLGGSMKGKIVDVHKGATIANVKIDVGGVVLTASITNGSVDGLGLSAGTDAYAAVKASEARSASTETDDAQGMRPRPNLGRQCPQAPPLPVTRSPGMRRSVRLSMNAWTGSPKNLMEAALRLLDTRYGAN